MAPSRVSSEGIVHRLDYVALPNGWQLFDVTSSTLFDVDLAIAREDHYVAHVEVHMAQRQSTFTANRRLRLDARKFHDPHKLEQFTQALATVPTFSWETGVGVHAEAFTFWLQDVVKKCFAKDTATPRQRYLSDSTWQIIQLRKALLKAAKQTSQHLHTLTR